MQKLLPSVDYYKPEKYIPQKYEAPKPMESYDMPYKTYTTTYKPIPTKPYYDIYIKPLPKVTNRP